MSNFISRTKASSHPTPLGGIYIGAIKSVAPDGKVFVSIPKLGNTIGPLRVLNASPDYSLPVGTQVLCAYTSASNDAMYVLGHISTSTTTYGYVTKEELRNNLINSYMTVD